MTVAIQLNLKLSTRFYNPFQVLQRIGDVAYKLDLPANAQIYLVFHVSQLKRKIGAHTIPQSHLPYLTTEGSLTLKSKKLLGSHFAKRGNRAIKEVSIQWMGSSEKDATWESLDELGCCFLDLVGRVF
jgi:hypothetical protein